MRSDALKRARLQSATYMHIVHRGNFLNFSLLRSLHSAALIGERASAHAFSADTRCQSWRDSWINRIAQTYVACLKNGKRGTHILLLAIEPEVASSSESSRNLQAMRPGCPSAAAVRCIGNNFSGQAPAQTPGRQTCPALCCDSHCRLQHFGCPCACRCGKYTRQQ